MIQDPPKQAPNSLFRPIPRPVPDELEPDQNSQPGHIEPGNEPHAPGHRQQGALFHMERRSLAHGCALVPGSLFQGHQQQDNSHTRQDMSNARYSGDGSGGRGNSSGESARFHSSLPMSDCTMLFLYCNSLPKRTRKKSPFLLVRTSVMLYNVPIKHRRTYHGNARHLHIGQRHSQAGIR